MAYLPGNNLAGFGRTGTNLLKLEAEQRRNPSMATIGRIIGAIILIALFLAIVVFLADHGF